MPYRTQAFFASFLFVLIGCSDLPATNPYDPQTPAEQQASASLTGQLVLGDGADETRFADARISLFAEAAAAGAELTADLEFDEVDGGSGGTAVFRFPNLPGGTYTLQILVSGYLPDDPTFGEGRTRLVQLGIGESRDLGPITLRPELAAPDGLQEPTRIRGLAQRSGAASHEGITVESRGTPYSAVTTSEGRFELTLPPGPHELEARFPGYAVARLAVEVALAETLELPDPIVLLGEPGAVAGRLLLPPGFVDFSVFDSGLVSLRGDGTLDPPAATTTVARDGTFLLEAVAAGAWDVDVAVDGFEDEVRDATVQVGARFELGVIALRVNAKKLTVDGLARAAGALDGQNAGTQLSVRGVGAPTFTDSAGYFSLDVSERDEPYVLTATRPGHTLVTVEVPGRDADGDGRYTVADILLVGEPGSVDGFVSLPAEHADPERLATTLIHRLEAAVGAEIECLTSSDCDAPTRCAEGHCRPIAETSPVDLDGRYRFAAVVAGRHRLVFELDGFYPDQREVTVEIGDNARVEHVELRSLPTDVVLLGRAELVGSLEHAGITVTVDGTPLRTETLDTGDFALGVQTSRVPYPLRFSKTGYAPVTIEVPGRVAAGPFQLPDVVLLEGQPGILRLLVRLPDGFDPLGLTEAVVEVVQFRDAIEVPVASLPVPANGSIIVQDLAAGRYVIEVRHDRFETAYRSVRLAVGEDHDEGVIVLAVPGAARATVRGHVTRDCLGGCDHGGIRVEAQRTPYVALTASDGLFEFEVPGGNTYGLRFSAAGYEAVVADEVETNPEQATDLDAHVQAPFVLSALRGRVRGVVTLPGGFDPAALMPQVIVELRPEGAPDDSPALAATAPIANGFFDLVDIAPGAYDLSVRLAGFERFNRPVTLEPGQGLDVGQVPLRPVGGERVSGRVLLDGVDAANGHGGTRITVIDTPYVGDSEGDGTFVVPAVAGDRVLRISHPDFQTLDVAVDGLLPGEQRVLGGPPIVLDIVPATVTGRLYVLTARRAAVLAADMNVELTNVSQQTVTTSTAADGTFRFDDHRAGAYQLRIESPEHVTVVRELTLRAGELTALGDIFLDLERGELTGQLPRADAPGVGGVTLIARRTATLDGLSVTLVERTVAGDDAYRFDGLPVGAYDVFAVADGYRPLGPNRMVVMDAAALSFDATLARRVHRLDVDPVTAVSPTTARFTADADLTFYRTWVDAAAPTPLAPWLRLPADGRVQVALAPAGRHVISAQLATDAFVNPGAGQDPLFAATSPVLSAPIVLDTQRPTVLAVELGDRSGFHRGGPANIRVLCADDLADEAALDLSLVLSDGAQYQGDYRALVPLALAAGDGPRTLTARCTDAAGNASLPFQVAFVVDSTPPSVVNFFLADGIAAQVWPEPDVPFTFEITDAVSGVAGAAIAESAVDCAAVPYAYPADGTFVFRLTPGEGLRSLFVCARDVAGNVTVAALASTNAIVLDTVAPAAPTVTLAAGAVHVQAANVALSIGTNDDDPSGYRVSVSGPFQGSPVSAAWAQRPVALTLTGGEGQKAIEVSITDAAGHTSPAVTRVTRLDLNAPQVIDFVIGNGSGYVTDPQGTTTARVSCVDSVATEAELRLAILEGPNARYDGAHRDLVVVPLGAAQAAHSLTARCTDPSGRSATSAPVLVTVDSVAPVVSTFFLADGAVARVWPDPDLDFTYELSDAGSGVAGVAISETAMDCAAAAYSYPAAGQFVFRLTPGEGLRTLVLCARDVAGNRTAASLASSNSILLDTVAPAAPTVTLAGGAAHVQAVNVALSVNTADDDPTAYRVQVSGPFQGSPLDTSWAQRPAALTLTGGEGDKAIDVQITDAAGHASPIVTRSTRLDLSAPQLIEFVVGDGSGFVSDAQGNTTARVSCVDSVATEAELRLTIIEGANARYDGALRDLVVVPLGAAQAEHALTARCTDPAGRQATSAPVVVTVDSVAPVVANFSLNGGAPNEPARALSVTAHVAVNDATSGVDAVSLTENQVPCGQVNYVYAPGDIGFTFSAGEGSRRLYLCARDLAGNTTAAAVASNALIVDTVAPTAGTLTLAGGAAFTNSANAALAIVPNEAGLQVRLGGDVAANQRGPFAVAAIPNPVGLVGGDGIRSVEAVLVDAAGNASLPFSDVVTLDTVAPNFALLSIADGAAVVNSRTVPVTVLLSVGETMRIWEVPFNTQCGALATACGQPGYVPFSANTSFVLSEGLGGKQLCVRLCDAAANGSFVTDVADQVTLGTYQDRPRPVLSTLSPSSRNAMSAQNTITLTGRGIASDTRAQIGEFILPCVSVNAEACRADADGGCAGVGGLCAQTCATQCTVTLPDVIMRNSGSHVVRLDTPAPVFGGQTISANALLFSVVAPLPSITTISPRGALQALDANSNPIAQNVTVTVRGLNFTDNVQFRLGPNVGGVTSLVDDPGVAGGRVATVSVSTAGLFPEDLVDYAFVAANPTPGGGERVTPFGINPVVTDCLEGVDCVSNLRWTRAPLSSGRGLAQAFALDGADRFQGLLGYGGTAIRFENSVGLQRGRYEHAGVAALPLSPFVELGRVTFESARGDNPLVRRATATFFPAGMTINHVGFGSLGLGNFLKGRPFSTTAADVNDDGLMDLAVVDPAVDRVQIYLAAAGQTFVFPPDPYTPEATPTSARFADFDMDGLLDMAVSNRGNEVFLSTVTLFRGLGEGQFGDRTTIGWAAGSRVNGIELVDVTRDGAPDLVACIERLGFGGLENGVQVRASNRDGTFGSPITSAAGISQCRGAQNGDGEPSNAMALADLNRDGDLDWLGLHDTADVLRIRMGQGDGTFGAPTTYAMGELPIAVAATDLDLDGLIDVVAVNRVNELGSNQVSIRYGTTSGALGGLVQLATGRADALAVAVGDLNADGYPDLAVSHNRDAGGGPSSDRVGVLYATGNRTFGAPVFLQAGGNALTSLTLTDLHGDGLPDLVATDPLTNNVLLFNASPGGLLGDRVYVTVRGPTQDVELGDLDNDGDLDAVTVSRVQSAYHVRLNNGSGTLSGGDFVGTANGAFAVKLARINADANLDLVIAAATAGDLYVYLGNGNGTFGNATTIDPGADTRDVAVGDVDADGDNDLVVVNYLIGSNDVRVLTQNVNGTFAAPVSFNMGAGPRRVALADINRDGDLDMVAVNGGNLVWRVGAAGSAFAASQFIATGANTASLALADFNRDGRLDVVTAGENNGGIRTHLGDGSGAFAAAQNPVPADVDIGTGGPDVVATDVNGDGLADIVLAARGVNEGVVILLGRGDGTFEVPVARRTSPRKDLLPNALGIGDLNGDQVSDIVVAHEFETASNSSLAVWRLPAPRLVASVSTNLVAPSVALAPGALSTFSIGQGAHFFDRVSARARFSGQSLQLMTTSLRSPNGDLVLLDNGATHVGQAVYTNAYSPTTTPALATLGNRWQPTGEWRLEVQNNGAVNARLEDFAVIGRGSVTRPVCGWIGAVPLQAGQTYVVTSTTALAPRAFNGGCAVQTHDGREQVFSFTAPVADQWRFSTLGSLLDTVLYVRRSCDPQQATELACNDDTVGNTSQVDVNLTQGQTVYVVVDSFGAASNTFTLTVSPTP